MPESVIFAAFWVQDYWQVIAAGGLLGAGVAMWGLIGPALLNADPDEATPTSDTEVTW